MISIISIPFEKPFLKTLAEELYRETASKPLKLGDYLLFLPTQRACRHLKEILVNMRPSGLSPLPKMIALGNLRSEIFPYPLISQEAAIHELDRQIILAKLIEKFPQQNGTVIPFSQAFLLANQLANLLDQTILEDLNPRDLEKIVPDNMASHWQLTHEFLKIIFEMWPKILEEKNQVDPGRLQKKTIDNLLTYWTQYPPQTPVWIAGSTGSLAITRKIMKGILTLPNGKIFLPGFDPCLSLPQRIYSHPTHPQHTMHMCCKNLEIPIEKIHILDNISPSKLARIFDPEHIYPLDANEISKFEHISVFECTSPESEAGVISILLREILEDPTKTGLLITPDRILARRVSTFLRRWNINVDDSSGKPLSECPVGVLARLLAQWLQEPKGSCIQLMSLLKHPLTHLGYEKKTLHRLTRRYEKHLRQGTPISIDKEDVIMFVNLVEKDLEHQKTTPFSISFFKALLCRFAGDEKFLLQTDDGKEVLRILNLIEERESLFETLTLEDFTLIFSHLLSQTAIRLKAGGHPRLTILGPLEARLLRADVVILASLNENTWPMIPDPDPWLSRQMRLEFGLQPLEQRIGLAAHDVLQSLHNDRVYLTRAVKADGSPTIPCRWLTRLRAITLKTDLSHHWKALSHKYESWWQALDEPMRIKPAEAPCPMPTRSLRPLSYSATQIETLIKDPYKFYATKILKLKELSPLELKYGAREIGILFHGIMESLFEENLILSSDMEAIQAIIRQKLDETGISALQRYFFYQEINGFLKWFIPFEKQRFTPPLKTLVETFGNMELKLPSSDVVKISAKFDRIDYTPNGHARIIDYKTGSLPSLSAVREGFFPQLPLEGLILKYGSMENIPPLQSLNLEYIRIQTIPEKAIQTIDKDTEQLMENIHQGLLQLLSDFLKENTPYLSQPHADFETRTSPFDHLARTQEWRAA